MSRLSILILLLTLDCSIGATPLPFHVVPKAACTLVLAGITSLERRGSQNNKLGPLSNHELDSIFARLSSDPSPRVFHATMVDLLQGDSELSKAIKTPNSLESQFLLAYMKWLAYRSEKEKLTTQEESTRAAALDQALQRTNVMEIMDQFVIRLAQQGKRLPQPITKLLFELMQGGVERIQVAADTFMLNGEIGNLVKTLDFLQAGENPADRDLYVAVMKLWSLDGGAPYAIQKTLAEFTDEEKLFFINLDPDSPLTLPSRHYSKMEIDAIRKTYRGTPLSKLSVEQVDRAVAYRDKWSLPHEILDSIKSHYPGRQYETLSLEEIDTVLHDLGGPTLLDRAVRRRLGFRMSLESKGAGSLAAPRQALVQNPDGSNPLVPTTSSHPVALAIFSPNELDGYRNAASQLSNVLTATLRLENAIAKIDRESVQFRSSVEVYRTYLNMSLYAPHEIKGAGGLYDVLAVASVEVGTEKDRADFFALAHGKFDNIQALMAKVHYSQSHAYRDVVTCLFNFVQAREHWNSQTLRYVFDKLDWLSQFEDPNRLGRLTAESILSEIRNIRRSEELSGSQVVDILENPSEARWVRYGVLTFKLSLAEFGITNEIGPIAVLEKLSENQKNSGEFFYDLHSLEKIFTSQGIIGYQIVEPSLHLMRAIVRQQKYVEIKYKKRYGKYDDQIREESTFYKNLARQTLSFDAGEIETFLNNRSSRGTVTFGIYRMNLRKLDFNMASNKTGKTLTITQIDSDKPGSGIYELTLRSIEQIARQAGYATLIVEGVDNANQWTFYEARMRYSRHPRDSNVMRSYFVEL